MNEKKATPEEQKKLLNDVYNSFKKELKTNPDIYKIWVNMAYGILKMVCEEPKKPTRKKRIIKSL